MMKPKSLFYYLLAKFTGKNSSNTPVDVIITQMTEKRPLPTGMTEFDEWADRIISGTLLPATPESQKFALAQMLIGFKPTEDHECDAYFIKSLRKSAINQIAAAKMDELRAAAKARLLAQQEAQAAVSGATSVVTPSKVSQMDESPKKYYETDDFKALEKEWEAKLKASEFEDAERTVNGERVLKQHAENVYRQADLLTRENKATYFTMIAQRTAREKFTNPVDKIVMTMLAEGKKIKEIVYFLQEHQHRRRSHGPIHRRTVSYIIRRYEQKWGIKKWSTKQLNLKQPIK